ncbi:MAG TPA: hypothetical protein VIY52_30775 [Streptosporangiaceae bacterium]
MDQAAEDAPTLDAFQRQLRDGVIWPERVELAAAMRSPSVVVGFILSWDQPEMAFAEDEHPVGDLGPGGEYEPFRISFRSWGAGRDLHGLYASIGQDRVKRLGELPGPVLDQEPEVGGAITQVHHQVADLLYGPPAVRVRGDSGDVHVSGAGLHDERASRRRRVTAQSA